MLHLTSREKKIWENIKKSQKYIDRDCLQNFILLFAFINRSNGSKQILAGIYFIFLKYALGQTWTSFKDIN